MYIFVSIVDMLPGLHFALAAAEKEGGGTEPGTSRDGTIDRYRTQTTLQRAGAMQISAGELRIQKDLADEELSKMSNIEFQFPNPADQMAFNVVIKPLTGMWTGGTYVFKFTIPSEYPHKVPKVTCETKIYHPNYDRDGNICLSILRDDWTPVCTITHVVLGLIALFDGLVNPDDPLNREAAALLRSNKTQFQQAVKRTLQGYASPEGQTGFTKFL